MIRLPKIKRDPKETKDLCTCRPVCKSRRREWNGKILETSAELLLKKRPVADCIRRWPTKVYLNSPCPLLKTTKEVTVIEKYKERQPNVVRLCQAPIDDTVPTPYLNAAIMCRKIGVLDLIPKTCPFCVCCNCCPCGTREYQLHDPDREARRRADRRKFDDRVKTEYLLFRNMYD